MRTAGSRRRPSEDPVKRIVVHIPRLTIWVELGPPHAGSWNLQRVTLHRRRAG